MEKELDEQWKAKSERQVSQMEDRWRRKHQDTLEELQQVQLHLTEARQRIDSLRSQDTAMQLQVGSLSDEEDAKNSDIAVQLSLPESTRAVGGSAEGH